MTFYRSVIANRCDVGIEVTSHEGGLPVLPPPPAGQPITTTFCTVLQPAANRIATQTDYVGG